MRYIFITTEGETLAPNIGYQIENCQMLGIVSASSKAEAYKNLVNENPWIEMAGFNISEARCIPILDYEDGERDDEQAVTG